jgi:PAS domain S-box-containing protein
MRALFTPPVFEGDEDKTRRAVLVNAMSLVTIALALIVIVGDLLGGHTPPAVSAIDGVGLVIGLALRAWLWRGGVRPAGAGIIAFTFIVITAGVALLGGVRAPATATYLLVVILAGLLFDWGGILVAGALSSLAIGGLILAENAGWLPRPDYAVTVTQWVTYTFLCGAAGGLTFYALHATRQALSRADAELAERRRAESQREAALEALHATTSKLETLIQVSPLAIMLLDHGGNVQLWNPSAERIFGWTAQEAIGHPNPLVPAVQRAEYAAWSDQVLRGQLLINQETVRQRRDGSLVDVSISSAPVYDAMGNLAGRMAIVADITEQVRAEKALRASEAHFREVFDNIAHGIFIIEVTEDGSFRVGDSNKAEEILTTIRREDVMGKLLEDAFPPDIAQALHVNYSRCLEAGVSIAYEEGVNLPGVGQRFYYTTLAPVRDESGRVYRIIGSTLEISERKRMEEALRLNEARLESLFELSQKEYATNKDLVDHALEEAVRLTGSQIGYFHFVGADQASLELFTWSRRARETCTAATDRHYPLEAAGVWADCARLKRPVIHNDYQTLSDKKGYPEGHSPITRHMSTPILDGDRVVAIAGVANKEVHYDDTDVRQLQLFMGEVWQMIMHKRAEEEREKLIEELQTALENIKTLSGLIPICANCKKIRDDQGYWHDVAIYVRDHSEADFTHGICPDCAKKLYPDFYGNTD